MLQQSSSTLTSCDRSPSEIEVDEEARATLEWTTPPNSTDVFRDKSTHTDISENAGGERYLYLGSKPKVAKNSTLNATLGPLGGVGDMENSINITNSELDKIELKLYENMSEEMINDAGGFDHLDTNIKYIKTNVQKILDNFKSNMDDFDLYKKKFHEILSKNHEDVIADMGEFIQDICQQVMSTRSSATHVVGPPATQSLSPSFSPSLLHIEDLDDLQAAISSSATDSLKVEKNDDGYSDYQLSGCTRLLDRRNFMSEVNIAKTETMDPTPMLDVNLKDIKQAASLENVDVLAAKKLQLDYQYDLREQESDREIPIKVSFAKKDIHLEEDFSEAIEKSDHKSLMAKICSYLCRKLRKF